MLENGEHILSWGTSWILKDATPNNESDYSYYMATNCHVCEIVYCASSSGNAYQLLLDDYLTYTDKDNLNYNYSSIQNGTGKFALYPGNSSGDTQHGIPTDDYKMAYTVDEDTSSSIDFRILTVDFGNPPQSISNKLDRVNEYCKNNNSWAVSFANEYSGNECYIGGYPYQTNNSTSPTWEFHEVNNYYEGTTSSHNIPTVFSSDQQIHIEPTTGQYVDDSPQINLPSVSYDSSGGYNWMNHGASGSMCINKDYQVVGIYWGGWIIGGNTYTPTLSIINDSIYKDFTSLI